MIIYLIINHHPKYYIKYIHPKNPQKNNATPQTTHPPHSQPPPPKTPINIPLRPKIPLLNPLLLHPILSPHPKTPQIASILKNSM